MKKIIISLMSICFIGASVSLHAEDYTDKAVKAVKIGDWNLIEFAAEEQIIYKVATEALNQNLKETYVSFYLSTSTRCEPSTAEMNMLLGSYSETLAHGNVPMSYKIPGKKEHTEVVDTRMEKGDLFAFFKFHALTLKSLLSTDDQGNLSIWIPGSGDGTVKRSSNMYFSLQGLNLTYSTARKRCMENL